MELRWLQKRRREEKKMSKEEGWAVCVLERIANFDLEIKISVPPFCRYGKEVKWSTQTHFGAPIAFEKAKNSPKTPWSKPKSFATD